MYDVTGRDSTMVAVSVSAPFTKVRVVERVRVNNRIRGREAHVMNADGSG